MSHELKEIVKDATKFSMEYDPDMGIRIKRMGKPGDAILLTCLALTSTAMQTVKKEKQTTSGVRKILNKAMDWAFMVYDPTLEETQAASTGAADAAASRKTEGRPRRMTKDIERQMVADLKAGMLLRDAAEKYGCCLTTAHHIKRRNLREIDPEGKGPLRGKRAFTPEQERQLAEDTQNGLSLTAAAAKYGCSEATVIRVRKRCGLAKRR